MLGLNPGDVRALSTGSIALFAVGQPVRAFEWSQRALELNPDDTSVLVNAACLRTKAGQKEQALALLEHVFGEGRGKRDWIEHDPDYNCLRGDPRFERLLGTSSSESPGPVATFVHPRKAHIDIRLDEISVDIAAVLLGSGVRLFDHLAGTPALLGNPTVMPGVGVTHFRYPVRKA